MRRQDGQRALRVALEVKIRFGPLCVRIYEITYILIQKKKKIPDSLPIASFAPPFHARHKTQKKCTMVDAMQ